MGSTNQDMSCSFGSRIWKKLKREVVCAVDDVLSLSCDFKYDVLKVEPYVSEPVVTDCETFNEKTPGDDPFCSVYAFEDVLSCVNGDRNPFMVTWSADEETVFPDMLPPATLSIPSEEEIAADTTILNFGAESVRTMSALAGHESPYIRALMTKVSSVSLKSDGHVFDFDHVWDEEDDEAPRVFAGSEPAEHNFVNCDLSEPADVQEPNFVMFDLPEAAEEKAPMQNFVIFDLSEPADVQEPNFVMFDLPEAAEEKAPMPNFILVYPDESPKVISDEIMDLMEMTIPRLASDVKEMEDACSEEVFLDDDANLAPMLIEDCQICCAAEQDSVSAAQTEQSFCEGAQISFEFLSGAFGNPGGSGIDFLFGKDEEDNSYPEHVYEVQTEQSAVRASPVRTQKMYL